MAACRAPNFERASSGASVKDQGLRSIKGRILVIEDQAILRAVYRRMLERSYLVDTVDTGQQALVRLGVDRSYDVVLCDMYLPDLDGRQVYRRLKEFAPECASRVLFCTGDRHELAGFFESVNNQVLEKPCTIQEMHTAVEAVLEAHRPEPQLLAAAQ